MRSLTQEMLRNPQMQEMLYPYFPETMRNPESFEMLLTDPTYKPVWKEIGVPTLKALFESHLAPDLPDEILHLIFSHAALDPRGGMPAVLAARGVCRSWRRAASSPALWRDIALRRWGFCADPGGDESEGYDQDADRALCLRLARAPEAPVSYARGRWHRAVAAARTFPASRSATRARRALRRAPPSRDAHAPREPPSARHDVGAAVPDARPPCFSRRRRGTRLITRTSSRRSEGPARCRRDRKKRKKRRARAEREHTRPRRRGRRRPDRLARRRGFGERTRRGDRRGPRAGAACPGPAVEAARAEPHLRARVRRRGCGG